MDSTDPEIEKLLVLRGVTITFGLIVQVITIYQLCLCNDLSCIGIHFKNGIVKNTIAKLKRTTHYFTAAMAFVTWLSAIDPMGMLGIYPSELILLLKASTPFLLTILTQEYALQSIRVKSLVLLEAIPEKPSQLFNFVRVFTPLMFVINYFGQIFCPTDYSRRVFLLTTHLWGLTWTCLMIVIIWKNFRTIDMCARESMDQMKVDMAKIADYETKVKLLKKMKFIRWAWFLFLIGSLIQHIMSVNDDVQEIHDHIAPAEFSDFPVQMILYIATMFFIYTSWVSRIDVKKNTVSSGTTSIPKAAVNLEIASLAAPPPVSVGTQTERLAVETFGSGDAFGSGLAESAIQEV